MTETGIDRELEAAAAREAGPAAGSPRVTADFDRAAPRYDLMVALNPGYHRHLRSAARALLERLPPAGGRRLLDLGCGSGASTRALLAAANATDPADAADPADPAAGLDILAVDASAGMLARALAKDWPAGVRFRRGLAQELATRRREWDLVAPLDGVFAAYLFRNIPTNEGHQGSPRDNVLRTVHGLLRPGGTLVVHEYSVGASRRARLVWTTVCRLVVMPLSRLTRTDVELYDYLWRSVLGFDSVDQFAERLCRAGFIDVEVRTASGWQCGILHTFRARVPPDDVS